MTIESDPQFIEAVKVIGAYIDNRYELAFKKFGIPEDFNPEIIEAIKNLEVALYKDLFNKPRPLVDRAGCRIARPSTLPHDTPILNDLIRELKRTKLSVSPGKVMGVVIITDQVRCVSGMIYDVLHTMRWIHSDERYLNDPITLILENATGPLTVIDEDVTMFYRV